MSSQEQRRISVATVAGLAVPSTDARDAVAEVIRRAREAQGAFADASQERADEAVRALAWSLYKPEHAGALADLAVADTGLGNVADKVVKKQRKTFGTLRDLLRARSVGIIEEDEAKGLVRYAKPMGVIGAITPSTNPGATPVNKAMMALKGRNAMVIAPSPLAYRTTATVVDYMRAELTKIGLPADLVQILPAPVTKDSTQALMEAVDLVVVTGSQDNVRRAYSSGGRDRAGPADSRFPGAGPFLWHPHQGHGACTHPRRAVGGGSRPRQLRPYLRQ
jgi:sulfoacetaldehyde dehydrogenase